ncbi:hypothetical protein CWI36_0129p0050, partial [Hamiltosporidium magnivora]
MGRKKNVSSKTLKNNKIKDANDADKVKKSESGIQKCELHPLTISLTSSSYTKTTHPPLRQTFSNMQNIPACEPSYDMTNPCTLAIPEGNRLMALRTIFDFVTADPKESPRIVFFGKCQEMAGQSFTRTIMRNSIGKEVKSEENGERRRIAACLADTCTLTDTNDKIKEISEKEIEKVVVRTRKLPSELVESKLWDLINRIIGVYADSYVPMTITAVARIIQAAQVCYDEATRKEKPRYAWKKNIEIKISKLVLSKILLEKARKQKKLSTSETKSLKKIM